ncbi:MAG: DoxX family protein [Mucilaginibacter sp.]|uniref:DoxX family protein n=1 Tax=Mucilaginibacter sp. TaxID=1882438 RepID=UPI0031AF1D88
MKNHINYAQLYLRIALGLGFIYPVLDRIGWLGVAGQHNVSWGNFDSFLTYTHLMLPFLSKSLSDIMGLLATIAEATFGILLLIGFKTRLVAKGSFALTLIFALCMFTFFGSKSPFNYSVFADSAGALLLSALPGYRYSLDFLQSGESKKIF